MKTVSLARLLVAMEVKAKKSNWQDQGRDKGSWFDYFVEGCVPDPAMSTEEGEHEREPLFRCPLCQSAHVEPLVLKSATAFNLKTN